MTVNQEEQEVSPSWFSTWMNSTSGTEGIQEGIDRRLGERDVSDEFHLKVES